MCVRSVEPGGHRGGAGDVLPVVVEGVSTRQGQTSQTSSSHTPQTTWRHTGTQAHTKRNQWEENKSDGHATQQTVKQQVKHLFDRIQVSASQRSTRGGNTYWLT